jgi:hypothetical protein
MTALVPTRRIGWGTGQDLLLRSSLEAGSRYLHIGKHIYLLLRVLTHDLHIIIWYVTIQNTRVALDARRHLLQAR